MPADRPGAAFEERQDAAPVAFPHDTWNSAEWIARHRTMTPGERIEVAVTISRAALEFAHASRAAPDER